MTGFCPLNAPIRARTLFGFFRVKAGCAISCCTRARPPGRLQAACTLNHWSMTRGLSLKKSAKLAKALAFSSSNEELTSTANAARRSVMLSHTSNCSRQAANTSGLAPSIR
ncbi:hypothetical protein D3C86_1886820 [compost metagenome]